VAHALRVRKEDAERVRRRLVKDGLLDSRYRIVQDGDFIIFPTKERLEGGFDYHFPVRDGWKNPYQRVKELVGEVEIPDYWEKYGSVLLLPPFRDFEENGNVVGEAFAKVLNVKTVLVNLGTRGEFREPNVVKIYGDGTETTHVENGIKYRFDAARIMFSSGNVNERVRMGSLDLSGEIVVDLFAGIGYFTLPIAIKSRARRVYACEKNPVAFYYLLENIELNAARNIIPLLGDNREVSPEGVADRVILGYIHTEEFLDVGFRALKSDGGVLHYHDTFTTEELPWKPEKIAMERGAKFGFDVKVLDKRIVKSYAPHIWHVVLDLKAIPKD